MTQKSTSVEVIEKEKCVEKNVITQTPVKHGGGSLTEAESGCRDGGRTQDTNLC